MTQMKGGRGHKAAYETATVRVPVAIKETVLEMADNYRAKYVDLPKVFHNQLKVRPELLKMLYDASDDETGVATQCWLEDKELWLAEPKPEEEYERLAVVLAAMDEVNQAIWQIDNSFPSVNLSWNSDYGIWKTLLLLVRYHLIEFPAEVKPATAREVTAWICTLDSVMSEMEWLTGESISDGRLDVFAALYQPKPVNRSEYWQEYYKANFGRFQEDYWKWVGNPEVREVCPELNLLLDKLPEPDWATKRVLKHLSDAVNPFYKEKPIKTDLGGGWTGFAAFLNSGKLANQDDSEKLLRSFIGWFEQCAALINPQFYSMDEDEVADKLLYRIFEVCFGASKARINELFEYHYCGQPEEKTCWQVLGLTSGTTKAQLKARYKEKAKSLHPDVNSAPDAKEQFQVVQDAYEQCLKELEKVAA